MQISRHASAPRTIVVQTLESLKLWYFVHASAPRTKPKPSVFQNFCQKGREINRAWRLVTAKEIPSGRKEGTRSEDT